jgi:hypothetical protein
MWQGVTPHVKEVGDIGERVLLGVSNSFLSGGRAIRRIPIKWVIGLS